jgi:hypothetical protein
MELLFDDRFAPITSEIGFFEVTPQKAVDAFLRWQSPIQSQRGASLTTREIAGHSLEDGLIALLPLTTIEARRFLFVPTASQWTAFFDNSSDGTDASSVVSVISRQEGWRGLRLAAVQNTVTAHDSKGTGRYGALVLECYARGGSSPRGLLRSVALVNDGGKWVFEEFGEPQEFEDTEKYKRARVTERFSFSDLSNYLRSFDVLAFDPSFYSLGETPAVLVEKIGKKAPGLKEVSLAKVQSRY